MDMVPVPKRPNKTMTWIRLTIIALGIIPPMMVLPLAALLADFGGTGRATLKAVLAHVLDTEVEITGPIDLGWSEGPRATIEGLRISDPDSTREKPLFVLEHGEIRLSFESALSGSLVISLLHLSGMAVNFHRRDDGSSNLAELSESVRREIGSQTTIIPLLGEVLVERAEIEFIDDASGKRARATIERLDQHRDGTAETATISASGTIMEQEFQLRGNTLPVELAIARKAPFPFTLTLTHHLMDLVLDGRLDPFADVPSLDVDFEFSAFSLTEIFEVLAPGIAMQGSLRVTGRVNGNPAKPALRALDLEMLMEGGGGVWLRGEISDARRLSGIDLSGSVEVSTAQPWLRDILDPKIHLPYLMASASISGNAETLELRDLKLVARDEFGASGTAKGQATLSIRDGVKFQRAETEIEITIADTGLSVAKFVPTFSQIGSAVFTGHLRLEPSGGIKLSGGSIAAAEFGGASIDVDGNLGNFPPATLRYAPNLEITLSGQVPRPAALIRLIHAEAPPLGSISFEAKLTGTPDGLSATEVKIEVDGPDGTRLKASGGI
jgi:hypothetical protein